MKEKYKGNLTLLDHVHCFLPQCDAVCCGRQVYKSFGRNVYLLLQGSNLILAVEIPHSKRISLKIHKVATHNKANSVVTAVKTTKFTKSLLKSD
jgi:hypothetical protein